MHELVQKAINTLIPIEEKKLHIDEAVRILRQTFEGLSDEVVEKVLKNNTSLFHALEISEEAYKIGYHTSELTSLRIGVFNVLVGNIRDFEKIKIIQTHLQHDLDKMVKLSKYDEILYNTNLFLLLLIHNPDFDKAITYGKKTLSLLEAEEGMVEEKLRLFSNFIQCYSLRGLIEEAQHYVEKGRKCFPLSRPNAYNALYVLAQTVLLNEQGNFNETIRLITSNKFLLDQQRNAYPNMYAFAFIQLCEAFIKKGDLVEGEKTFLHAKNIHENFFSNKNDGFSAKLLILKALKDFPKKENFTSSKKNLEGALKIYNTLYKGTYKHKNQGSVYLCLGKLHFLNQKYEEAKKYCLKSEKIYDKVLKGKRIYDMSQLYKLLAILGRKLKKGELTHTYSKKYLKTFGLDHPKTVEAELMEH